MCYRHGEGFGHLCTAISQPSTPFSRPLDRFVGRIDPKPQPRSGRMGNPKHQTKKRANGKPQTSNPEVGESRLPPLRRPRPLNATPVRPRFVPEVPLYWLEAAMAPTPRGGSTGAALDPRSAPNPQPQPRTPAPCTRNPAPCNSYPKPCSLQPTKETLSRATLTPDPKLEIEVMGYRHGLRVEDLGYRVQGFGVRVEG